MFWFTFCFLQICQLELLDVLNDRCLWRETIGNIICQIFHREFRINVASEYISYGICGGFAFVTVNRNLFKSNIMQKFVIPTVVRIIFGILSHINAQMLVDNLFGLRDV